MTMVMVPAKRHLPRPEPGHGRICNGRCRKRRPFCMPRPNMIVRIIQMARGGRPAVARLDYARRNASLLSRNPALCAALRHLDRAVGEGIGHG